MTDETDTAGEIKEPGCKQIDWIGIFGFRRNQWLMIEQMRWCHAAVA
ncbi:MAG: hypothetical protein ACLRTT_01010 [Lachnospiraceae bacterium]